MDGVRCHARRARRSTPPITNSASADQQARQRLGAPMSVGVLANRPDARRTRTRTGRRATRRRRPRTRCPEATTVSEPPRVPTTRLMAASRRVDADADGRDPLTGGQPLPAASPATPRGAAARHARRRRGRARCGDAGASHAPERSAPAVGTVLSKTVVCRASRRRRRGRRRSRRARPAGRRRHRGRTPRRGRAVRRRAVGRAPSSCGPGRRPSSPTRRPLPRRRRRCRNWS